MAHVSGRVKRPRPEGACEAVVTGFKSTPVTAYSKWQSNGVAYTLVSFERAWFQSDAMSENTHRSTFPLVLKVCKVAQPTLTSGGGGCSGGDKAPAVPHISLKLLLPGFRGLSSPDIWGLVPPWSRQGPGLLGFPRLATRSLLQQPPPLPPIPTIPSSYLSRSCSSVFPSALPPESYSG